LPPCVPIIASYFGDNIVVICMRAGLYQTKNGLLVFLGSLRSRKQAIIADPFFDQVMVIGEQRPFIAALAVLNRSAVEQAAKDLGIAGELDEALQSEQFRALALAKIGRAVAQFPKYATPRKVWLTVEPWTIGAALITPTLKPKRLAIERAFAAEIERLYAK